MPLSTKIICLIAFVILLAVWSALVFAGKTDAAALVSFLQLGAASGGSVLLALMNPQGGTQNILSKFIMPKTTTGQTAKLTSVDPEASVQGKADGAVPGFDKASGFASFEVLGSIILMACAVIALCAMLGCGKVSAEATPHYTPPAACANTWNNATGAYTGGDSEILTVLPNPTATGVILQVADLAAIKAKVYSAADALAVIADIEAALNAATDYGTLAVYVTGKLADANTAAGTQIFVSTGLLEQFTSKKIITDCDKAIILKHLAAQKAIIAALAGSK